MIGHLSEDQLCRCIAQHPTSEELEHLAACSKCAFSVERTRLALANFRVGFEECASAVRVIAPPATEGPRRNSVPVWCAAFVAVVTIGYSVYSGRHREAAPSLYDDNALLNKVQADVQRGAPSSLLPLVYPDGVPIIP